MSRDSSDTLVYIYITLILTSCYISLDHDLPVKRNKQGSTLKLSFLVPFQDVLALTAWTALGCNPFCRVHNAKSGLEISATDLCIS